MKYEAQIPFLDECGAVYLPALGPSGCAVRLNKNASAIWRKVITNSIEDVPPDRDEQSFISWLIERGALAPANDDH